MTTNISLVGHGLARHYYEVRREVLAAAGITVTPWYQLTADDRAVAEAEANIVAVAVQRAIEEQQALTAMSLRSMLPPPGLADQPPVTAGHPVADPAAA